MKTIGLAIVCVVAIPVILTGCAVGWFWAAFAEGFKKGSDDWKAMGPVNNP